MTKRDARAADSQMIEPETEHLIERVRAGERKAMDILFSRHSERLLRMIRLRLSPALRGRLEAADVLQDAFLEASRRMGGYLKRPTMPFFLWLRFLTAQQISRTHRNHLGIQARDARRERSLSRRSMSASSDCVAQEVLAERTSPSQAAARDEAKAILQKALDMLDPLDREVLVLRHFEHLTIAEAAAELEIGEEATKKRHSRALLRVRDLLRTVPGGLDLFSTAG